MWGARKQLGMSNLSPVILRIITCTVLGVVLRLMDRVHDIVMSGESADLGEMPVAAVSGALYGIFAGLIWAIKHKPARLRFILGLAAGFLFILVFDSAVPTVNPLPVALGLLAGTLVGGVMAFSKVRDVSP